MWPQVFVPMLMHAALIGDAQRGAVEQLSIILPVDSNRASIPSELAVEVPARLAGIVSVFAVQDGSPRQLVGIRSWDGLHLGLTLAEDQGVPVRLEVHGMARWPLQFVLPGPAREDSVRVLRNGVSVDRKGLVALADGRGLVLDESLRGATQCLVYVEIDDPTCPASSWILGWGADDDAAKEFAGVPIDDASKPMTVLTSVATETSENGVYEFSRMLKTSGLRVGLISKGDRDVNWLERGKDYSVDEEHALLTMSSAGLSGRGEKVVVSSEMRKALRVAFEDVGDQRVAVQLDGRSLTDGVDYFVDQKGKKGLWICDSEAIRSHATYSVAVNGRCLRKRVFLEVTRREGG